MEDHTPFLGPLATDMFVGTHSLDEEHWKKMTSVTDEKKARVWNGLLDGFEKYLGVLTEKDLTDTRNGCVTTTGKKQVIPV